MRSPTKANDVTIMRLAGCVASADLREGGTVKPQNTAATDRVPSLIPLLSLARHVSVAGIAGLITGLLVGGVGGRLFMRIAGAANPGARGRTTEAGFTVGRITADGTLGLVLFVGLFVGVGGAVLYVIFRPWLSRAGKGRGAAFGVLLFGIGSATSDVLNPDNVDFLILGNQGLLVGMVFALFVGFGVLIDWLFGVLDRRLPAADRRRARLVYPLMALLGLGMAALFVPFALFSDQACNCEPPVLASTSVVVAAVGTIAWWWNGLRATTPSTPARVLGLGGLAGALVFGLVRAISDAVEIMR
jgi:hypothetical protein